MLGFTILVVFALRSAMVIGIVMGLKIGRRQGWHDRISYERSKGIAL